MPIILGCQDVNSFSYILYSPRTHTLNLLTNKIRSILTKEKELTSASSQLNSSINCGERRSRDILDSFRSTYIENANFAGAHCLYDIYQKRINNTPKKDDQKHQHHNQAAFNSSTTSSSSSTSTLSQISSPGCGCLNRAEITNTSTTNNDLSDGPVRRFPVGIDEVNDKLFLCFLSNFSCRSVEKFLLSANQQQPATTTTTMTGLEQMNAAGFVRKHKSDRTFSYLTNSDALASHEFTLSKFKFTFR